MSGWILAIDFGTTSTAAARRVGDRVEMIQLQNGPRMPSLVFWREGTGSSSTGRLVLGAEAEELSTLAPWCLERTPKNRLGEDFIQLGDKQLRPVEIVAAILREVHNEALSLSGGEPPSEIRLTHPARWRRSRLDELSQAAKLAGLADPVFVPEPVAAAVHFASERLADGEHVAVYDLGGGTLDTAVLKRVKGSFEVVGRTGGNEELGGEDFDDLLYRYLGDQLPGDAWKSLRSSEGRQDRLWAQANRELQRQSRKAKEGLSRHPQYEFYLPPPIDQELSATVGDFERLIAPTLKGTVSELERTILAAGLQTSDMAAIYLAGGSSRIPLVGRLIQEQLGISPEHLDDPKAVIALGAARLETSAAKESGVSEAPLSEADAPIPPLPTDPGPPPGPPPPPPPTTPPRQPQPPRGPQPPTSPGPTSPTTPGGSGGNRTKILAGVAAAVVVLGGVAAAITLGGGGGGGGSDDTTITDPPTDPPPPPPPPEDELKQMIGAQFRDCTPEPEKDWEDNATVGLYCGGPNGTTTTLEAFDTPEDTKAAFEVYASGLSKSKKFCDVDWNLRTTWVFQSDPNTTVGSIACTTTDGTDLVIWTDDARMGIGFLFSDNDLHAKTFNAWDQVIHE